MGQRGVETALKQRNLREAARQKQIERQAELRRLSGVAQAKEKTRQEEAAAKVKAADTLAGNQRRLAKLKAGLKKKDIDPLDKRKKELDIQKLEKELSGESGGMTPYQQAQLQVSQEGLQLRLDNAKSAADQKAVLAQQELMDFILSPESNPDAVAIEAQRANTNPASDVIYYYDTDWENEWAVMPIPQGLMFNGQKATATEISRRAELAGMDVDHYLEELQKRSQ